VSAPRSPDGALRLLLTPNEAAAALAVSRSKLYRLMRSGRVQSVMLDGNRRITVTSLERLVEGLTAVTPPVQDEPGQAL